ncbi:N-acetylglucosamine-specific PTS transporter subunit IIBC [Alkalihalobacillus sp. NPDC078783]
MMNYLQRIGRSLMLPVAVLPAAAILMGIGYWIDPSGWGSENVIAAFLIIAGESIIEHIPILFAVGVALGMSKQKDGAAALSGLVAFLVITTLLSAESISLIQGIEESEVNMAFSNIENVFIGIISGLIASVMFNRFSHVQLPSALAFFSGKRLVPILTSAVMILASVFFYIAWPTVYNGLVTFGESISTLGAVGAGIYGFVNRLLIPIGLHHALNSVFWFDLGINDIGNFWSGTGVKGVTGMYQAGFFPIMMFGIPAAGLAMYHTAKTNKKKVVASLMLAGGFAAFLTGVTEPVEFAFMFVAPLLYIVHALLTGLSFAIAASFEWTAGFGFSAGLIDFVLSSRLPMANQPYMLLLQGLFFFMLYYFIFKFLILKFDIKTPGREDEEVEEVTDTQKSSTDRNVSFTEMATKIYKELGGQENVTSIDNCVTRLRLEVVNPSNIDSSKLKAIHGVSGFIVTGKTSVQVVVGTQVQFVADEMKRISKE